MEEKESDEQYEHRYNVFINSIRIDKTYAGDYEIVAAAIILQRKIIVYRNSITGYEFLNEYNSQNNPKEKILLIYKNNNFNLLIENKKEILF